MIADPAQSCDFGDGLRSIDHATQAEKIAHATLFISHAIHQQHDRCTFDRRCYRIDRSGPTDCHYELLLGLGFKR
jgi:hypothetical protein